MATYGRALRRGLPRAAGGEAWPPAGEAAGDAVAAPVVDAATSVAEAPAAPVAGAARPVAEVTATPVAAESAAVVSSPPVADVEPAAAPAAPTAASVTLRRGLPRTPGGEPWPPASATAAVAAVASAPAALTLDTVAPAAAAAPAAATPVVDAPAAVTAAAASAVADAGGASLRRGLPRTTGGEPWPPAGTARAAVAASAEDAPAAETPASVPTPAAAETPAPAAAAPVAPAPAPARTPAPVVRAPLTVPRTVWPGRAAFHRPPAAPAPRRLGPFTRAQWAGVVVIGGGGLLVAAALAVLFVRALLSMPALQDFLAAYPGEYHLPEGAPVGIPAWLGWQHFLNGFFMLLIIKTGLTIRTEKRPAVFWTPRRDKKGKTSLTIWFHQALDVLWIVNGVVFVVLLFVTGQWMRIVPTSWEVFPNALSAALQYVSLDWPTENGWVNYNSLQQLAYFATVFVAAPLAFLTGIRMSGVWPRGNTKLNTLYPIDWARKVHFPVMLYFVAFIIVHVALVLSTGALRNLGHMYAAQGSTDPTAYADNWLGFWMFVLSLAVMAGAWIAARPMVIAPIARLFGTVSGR
ncbi:cytochrome b/b6 domain-containing protein [Microbacterium sp. W1N]|uniref:cytochrome b/b6 domain-containing protein n=1 Tax=Microbacterium festucae TaxID=2977531 RepID=UPI0021C0ECB2|nr:cytochrome b/b6 domain-containing protein [Microbacterium festucae]MCT9819749.1 cytochrome b/b6 domain-containing protein [Microbacterium festucae]